MREGEGDRFETVRGHGRDRKDGVCGGAAERTGGETGSPGVCRTVLVLAPRASSPKTLLRPRAHRAGGLDRGLALSLGTPTTEDPTQDLEKDLPGAGGAAGLVWLSLPPGPHRRWPSLRGTLSWRRSSRPTKTRTLVSSAHSGSLPTVGLWVLSGARHCPCTYGDALREGPV